MNGYDPNDDAEYYADMLQAEQEFTDEESARADEAERLLSEMAHAFREADKDAFEAFRAEEPGIEVVL